MKSPHRKQPRNSVKGAPRTRATTRSTAGPGYDFEDRIAAWIMVGMLRGAPLPTASVYATEIRWQTRNQIDDLAVLGQDAQGARHVFALSCKSSVQVTANGLPQDFVEAAWLHLRAHAAADGVCRAVLMARDNHPPFNAPWAAVPRTRGAEPSRAQSQISHMSCSLPETTITMTGCWTRPSASCGGISPASLSSTTTAWTWTACDSSVRHSGRISKAGVRKP